MLLRVQCLCHTHFRCAVEIYRDHCFLINVLLIVVASWAIPQLLVKLFLSSYERSGVLAKVETRCILLALCDLMKDSNNEVM